MKKRLSPEIELFLLIKSEGLPTPEKEYRFHVIRRWRFDLAFVNKKIAVEMEGGIWKRGRHNRPQGFIKDCEKYNMAQKMGWKVLRYTPQTMNDAIGDLKYLLNCK